jgi:hypothetical protein
MKAPQLNDLKTSFKVINFDQTQQIDVKVAHGSKILLLTSRKKQLYIILKYYRKAIS